MSTMYVAQQTPGSVDLMRTKHRKITTLEDLRAAAQLAIQVEFTTIPAYLTALYSITDRASTAYQTIRSVVMEEMFHINQAANILIGVGGAPRFTGSAAPKYPTYLPAANKERTPYVGLYPASPAVLRNVFMSIETPAAFAAPPEDEEYETIGQLYAALWDGIVTCIERYGAAAVFRQAENTRQRIDIYLGKFGGKPIAVTSRETAHTAIEMIVGQGEGAVTMQGTLIATQPYGAYHHYGMRADGTYGPILGTPIEASHYVKFLSIAEAPGFPETFPIVSNPRLSDYTSKAAIEKTRAFNKVYSLMLDTLERSFRVGPAGADPYFQVTLPLMHANMAELAHDLMNTPIRAESSPQVGPNAAPTFEYEDGHGFDEVIAALGSARAAADPGGAAVVDGELREQNTPRVGPRMINRIIRNFEDLKSRAETAGIRV